ncbi:Transcription elongation factor GreA [Bienertia sinuspersici]
MRQSRARHEFDYYRGVDSRSVYYNDGGEVGYGRGRNLPFQLTSTPASRPKALEVGVGKRLSEKKNKQTKLSTSLFEKAKKVVLNGTIFHKLIDAPDVLCKDTTYYYKLMKKVVEEICQDKVFQVVTDNEADIKAGGKKLMEQFPHL